MQIVDEAQATLFSQPLPSIDQIEAFARAVNSSERNQLEFAAALEQAEDSVVKGIGWCILGNYKEAANLLRGGKDCIQKSVYLGRALRKLGRTAEALAAFDAAMKQKGDFLKVTLEKVETLTKGGRFEEATKQLKSLSNFEASSAAYHYSCGMLLEAQSRYDEASEEYKTALVVDPSYSAASFRLGYLSDMLGDDATAASYYQQAADNSPVHVSSLLNLSVIYEDMGKYEKAEQCVEAVLASYPNNTRARLFLKDIYSSQTMVYDDEREKKMDRRNKLLETPITDFELSVRSRNCLRKMNIRTLGDLLRIGEAELLAYKNFGETSLREIRAILESKNLRLGMAIEEKVDAIDHIEEPVRDTAGDLLNKSVEELSLSVRARKCLERLGVSMIGELLSRTEAELLGCKNFGATSLNEIKGRLTDMGLSLRKLD